MRFFFRSRQFKIIAAVFAALIVLSAIFALVGSGISPQADIAGALAAPFQSFATRISNAVKDFSASYRDGNELLLQNTELKAEINQLRRQVADYDKISEENEFYKNYLSIKDEHTDFEFCPATLIARDPEDPYFGFTVNKGSADGISCYDPVITDAGLVGYITEVGVKTAKVTTLFSPDLTLGALNNRTHDSGIVSGTLGLTEKGLCKFYNLSRSCTVAIGDYVITSGEGIFPNGLLIGKIESIGSDPYNTSIFANVKPFVDFSQIRNVMVISKFDGQRDLNGGTEK